MKQYAMEQGIPERDILVETNSTTTLENMLYSKEIMDQQMKGPYRAIFSSNNYHIFRAGLYARQAKLKANGIGAKTAFYYLPNAFLREYLAILMMNKKTYDHLRIAFRRLRILIADYFTFLKTRCDKTYVTPCFFFHSLNYWQRVSLF